MGVGDVITASKRKDISPLAKMNVKKIREATTDEVNQILERTSIETFKVQVKNSTESGGKWATIGTVQIRDPGMYGQLSQDSIKENILVELSLMEE